MIIRLSLSTVVMHCSELECLCGIFDAEQLVADRLVAHHVEQLYKSF